MTDKQVEVLKLRFCGLSFAEIGECMGISAPAALYLHRRALTNLKEVVEDYGHKKVTITVDIAR